MFLKSAYLLKFLPFSLFAIITLGFFWRFTFLGEIPIPGDILIGTYYPWINDNWGYAVSVPVKNPLMSDVVSLMYPWRKLAVDYIKAGQLPLWDPTAFLGQSLIGNFQAGIFNPANFLFFLPLGFNFAWGLQVMLQIFLALVFMYLLLKGWGFSKRASFFGSIAYAFCGPMIVWVEYNVLGFAIAYFPLAIYLIDKYTKERKLRYLSLYSALISFVIFAGYLQFIYYIAGFSFIYLMFRNYLEVVDLRKNFKDSFLFILANIFGILLSAAQFLPGFEAFGDSIRGLDRVAEGNALLSVPWQHLITFFSPDFFGNPATYNYWGAGYYESFILYTSIAAVSLAVFSYTNIKRRNLFWFLLTVIFISILYSFSSPLTDFFQIGFLGLKGSVSGRILFAICFGVAVLGAIGYERVFEQEDRLGIRPFIIPAVLLGMIIGIKGCDFFIKTVSAGGGYEAFLSASLANILSSFRNTLLQFLYSLVILISILLRRVKFSFLVIFALMLFEVFRFGNKYLPFTKESLIFPKTPAINYLLEKKPEGRFAAERGELLTANTWSSYGLENITGYSILLSRQTADYISFINTFETGKSNSRFLDISNFDSKLLDVANVKFLAALLRQKGSPDENGTLSYNINESKFRKVFQEGAVVILENANAQKRVYSPGKLAAAKNQGEALKIISDSDDYLDLAVLEKDLGNGEFEKCDNSVIKNRGGLYEIEADCSKRGILVITEQFSKGWKARINGKKSEVLKANGNFMGVLLGSGKSKVDLEFLPGSFVYGVVISVISWGLLIIYWYRKR